MPGLQGHWEGEGPPGEVSITITGNSLHYYAGPDSEYENVTFILPAGTDPQQLHATVTDSSGHVAIAYAIVKIEGGTLRLAVDDGSDTPLTTLADASRTRCTQAHQTATS